MIKVPPCAYTGIELEINTMANTSFTFSNELRTRLDGIIEEKETYSQFAYKAFVERINRMEKRDERSRIELMKRDKNAIRSVVMEIVEEYMNGINK